MNNEIMIRQANLSDALKLSILFSEVYIHTYGIEGVSDEFAHYINKQFSVERLERLITHHPYRLVVAAKEENLVGVAEIEFDTEGPAGHDPSPELNKLYILDRFCGQGIGHRLLRAAERVVVSKGINEMWLWVLDSNFRAIKFYEQNGYKCIGTASYQMEVNCYENKVMLKRF